MMKLLFVLVLSTPLFCHAGEKRYGDVIVTEVSTVYDGDTFYISVKDWPPIVGDHIAVRVNGVDTPEMKGSCDKEIQLARKAKQFTVQKLRSAKTIELRNIARDKYFRIDADVFVDGQNLATLLINNNLGYAYFGSTKRSWCNP